MCLIYRPTLPALHMRLTSSLETSLNETPREWIGRSLDSLSVTLRNSGKVRCMMSENIIIVVKKLIILKVVTRMFPQKNAPEEVKNRVYFLKIKESCKVNKMLASSRNRVPECLS